MSVQALTAVLGHRVHGRWVVEPLDTGGSKEVRLLMVSLANRANDQGVAWPSVETLCAEMEMTESGVQRAISRAVEMGLIERVVNGARGAGETVFRSDRRPNLYRLTFLERGATCGTPQANGVPHVNERGPTRGANGVPCMGPEPSIEPSKNRAVAHLAGSGPATADITADDYTAQLVSRGVIHPSELTPRPQLRIAGQ